MHKYFRLLLGCGYASFTQTDQSTTFGSVEHDGLVGITAGLKIREYYVL